MKILIISTLPASSNTNIGKTIASLFGSFNKEELCQLYFNGRTPNVPLCAECYQICEKRIVKDLLHLKKSGCIVEPKESNEIPKSNTFGKKKLLRFSAVWLLREVIWDLGTWKTKSLRNFITENDFDLIFFVMPEFNYPIRVLKYIMNIKRIPTVLYVTDNYYDYLKNVSPMRQWINNRHKKMINRLKDCICGVVGCSDEASQFFSDLYKVPSLTAYVPNIIRPVVEKKMKWLHLGISAI